MIEASQLILNTRLCRGQLQLFIRGLNKKSDILWSVIVHFHHSHSWVWSIIFAHLLSECWWPSSYVWSISVSLCFTVSPPFFFLLSIPHPSKQRHPSLMSTFLPLTSHVCICKKKAKVSGLYLPTYPLVYHPSFHPSFLWVVICFFFFNSSENFTFLL